jgi:hypothetical protein
MMTAIRFDVEYTDTFGGEANYCWVRRATIEVPREASQALIMRRAKAAMGLSGDSGRTESEGDGYRFVPYHSCTVLFVTYRESEA